MGAGGGVPRPQHSGLLRSPSSGRARRLLAGGGPAGRSRPSHQPWRRHRDVGDPRGLRARAMVARPRPAFYAPAGGGRLADAVTPLHPPYTLRNLSYLALGAAVAPHIHLNRLLWVLAAVAPAVGVAAHALA